jgi:hypothetical protein
MDEEVKKMTFIRRFEENEKPCPAGQGYRKIE